MTQGGWPIELPTDPAMEQRGSMSLRSRVVRPAPQGEPRVALLWRSQGLRSVLPQPQPWRLPEPPQFSHVKDGRGSRVRSSGHSAPLCSLIHWFISSYTQQTGNGSSPGSRPALQPAGARLAQG